MTEKLSKCKPAQQLLLFSGFHLSNNKKRLIWSNTKENMTVIKYIHNALNSIINPASTINTYQHKQQIHLIFDQMQQNATESSNNATTQKQTQKDITNLVSNLIMNQSAPFHDQPSVESIHMHYISSSSQLRVFLLNLKEKFD